MRSEWVCGEELWHVLSALTLENRLACEVSLATGLRIGDVLSLKTEKVKNSARFTIKEQKTGKSRIVYLPAKLRDELIRHSGRYYCFEHRLNTKEHRTRQAVFKDIRRASKAFRISSHLSTHSLRKAFAVEYFKRHGSLKKVQNLLNHSTEAVTLLYAMADKIKSPRKPRT